MSDRLLKIGNLFSTILRGIFIYWHLVAHIRWPNTCHWLTKWEKWHVSTFNIKSFIFEARKMVRWVRALTVLLDDLSLVLRTPHWMVQSCSSHHSSSREPDTLFWILGASKQAVHTHTCRQNTDLQKERHSSFWLPVCRAWGIQTDSKGKVTLSQPD